VGQVVDGTGGQRSGVGAGGLDTTNAMLRSVIDGIADPVDAKDAEGRYLLVDPPAASAAGLRPDQVLGCTDAELLPGPAAARLRADRWVMASELPSQSREELASPEGPRVYQALKAPWRDAGGRIAGAVGVSRDVTEEERADRDRLAVLGECEAGVAGGVAALRRRLAVRAREEGGTTVEACIPGPPGRPA
jgi:PAS domain S-box-containing protein